MKNSKPSIFSAFHQFAQPELLPLTWRISIVAVSVFLYFLLFFTLQPIIREATSALSAIPVIAVAWFFGFRMANLAFFIILAFNFMIFSISNLFRLENFLQNNGLTGVLLLLATAAFIGRMSDLRKRAQNELQSSLVTEQALSSNRAHLQALYHNIQDAVLFVDDQAKILEVNPAACRLMGYSHDELIGLKLSTFATTSPGDENQLWKNFLVNGRMQGESTLTCKNGAVIIVELLALSSVLPGENVMILHDVTQTRKNEFKITRLLEVERQNRSLAEALTISSAALNSTLNLDEVLDQILVSVGLVVPHTAANIMLVEGDQARIVKAKGYQSYQQQDFILSISYTIRNYFNLRYLAENAKPIAISNTRTDARWIKSDTLEWIGSYAAAPIIIEGNVIGFLNLDSQQEDLYTQEHAQRLMAFANQAAIAIRNAQLFNQLQVKARQTTIVNDLTQAAISASTLKEMAQSLADRLLQLFDAYGAYITLWDDEQQKPIPTAASGYLQKEYPTLVVSLGEYTLTHLALECGIPKAISDITQVSGVSKTIIGFLTDHETLVIPLIADQKPLGAAIIVFQTGKDISSEDLTLAEQICPQISLAVAKARLLTYEQIQLAEIGRTNQLLSALSRMAARIASAHDLETIFSTLGDELKSIGVFCLVGLQDEDGGSISVQYFSRLHPVPEKWQPYLSVFNTFDTNFPLFPIIMEQRKPIFITEPIPLVKTLLIRFPQHIQDRLIHLFGFHSGTRAICLPLIADEKVVGVITLWGDDIRESDQPAALLFSSQVAIAIQKARLISEIQQMVITDELTGVHNRRGLYEHGQQEVDRSRRFNHPLSLLFVDVDYFKDINDQFGHNIGDEVLVQISQRIQANVRELDVIGRYGGDEFLVILVETELSDAITTANRLLKAIAEEPFISSAGPISATLSIGIAELNDLDDDFDNLIVRSDQLLYLAKENGRNRMVY